MSHLTYKLKNPVLICIRKNSYPTLGAAKKAGLRIFNVRGPIKNLSAYKCPVCKNWHLTSKSHGKKYLVKSKTVPKPEVLTPPPRPVDVLNAVQVDNQVCSPVPLMTQPIPEEVTNFTDLKKGTLVVQGYLGQGRWSAKCVCGNHVVRTSKSLRNELNFDDRCVMCRKDRKWRFKVREQSLDEAGHDQP